METKEELQNRLESLKIEHRKVYSILSMMEKGTRLDDLVKMRKEKLDPIRDEIKRVEDELKGLG
jgi:hypothetical protein